MNRTRLTAIFVLTVLLLYLTPMVSGKVETDSISSIRPLVQSSYPLPDHLGSAKMLVTAGSSIRPSVFSSIRFQGNRYLYCRNDPVNRIDPKDTSFKEIYRPIKWGVR